MLSLTPIERDMHRLLRSLAQAGDPGDPLSACISYTEFAQRVDPHGLDPYTSQNQMHGLYPKLGHISVYEHQHGRPLLSALVVAKATRRPGNGFVELASRLGFEAARRLGSGSIRWLRQCASGPLTIRSC
ncbi:hypothetical protein [Streptomyces sp. RerS4]|uniref:hypothetical protein n=1 Tax=Streptomyces sp. RerS4 TaxID=2942449 RepID=UPI00201C578D|nr:hypothetical protein [Streptomyces sp. RerS4]UQW99257.1 hypothetical protein M4D82_00910 [Streptomyces sp. RerS4]